MPKNSKIVELHQSNDLPYPILKQGVLFYNNNIFTTTYKTGIDDYGISFKTSSDKIVYNTRTDCSFHKLPTYIPKNNVISLQNQFIDIDNNYNNEGKTIAIIRDKCVKNSQSRTVRKLMDENSDYNHMFVILANEIVDNELTTLFENMTIIYHESWYKTCLLIAHILCENSDRNMDWTKSISGLDIACVGFKKLSTLTNITNAFEMIEVETSISLTN